MALTEAGQAAFAPGSDREIDVLRITCAAGPVMSLIEQLLSGPGLVNLHSAPVRTRWRANVVR